MLIADYVGYSSSSVVQFEGCLKLPNGYKRSPKTAITRAAEWLVRIDQSADGQTSR